MIIGNLNKDLKGKISTLEASFPLKIVNNERISDEKSPTHNVIALNKMGDSFQIGSAWERNITEGKSKGLKMYSLSIDDPSFKSPLNCAAFPTDDGYNISFDRKQEK